MSTFYIPSINMMGKNCLNDAIEFIVSHGLKHALVVTDKDLVKIGLVNLVTDKLNAKNIETTIYDGTKPNPNIKNVEDGLEKFKTNGCNFIISLGGGSPLPLCKRYRSSCSQW